MSKPMNKTVKALLIGDGLLWAGIFFNSALAAVFLAEQLGESAITIIGSAFFVFLAARAAPQYWIAQKLDSNRSQVDEFKTAFAGTIVIGLTYAAYALITLPWHLYAISLVSGLGFALYLPAWRKLFNLNLDKGNEGMNSAFLDLSDAGIGALATVLGSYAVDILGDFRPVFVTMGVVAIVGGWAIIRGMKKG